jgi:hypothetical protein
MLFLKNALLNLLGTLMEFIIFINTTNIMDDVS